MDYSPQSPLSAEFSRQAYWSGLPFPSLGNLPKPGIRPGSPVWQGNYLPSEPPGKPTKLHTTCKITSNKSHPVMDIVIIFLSLVENKSKTFVFSLNSLFMPCTWASLVAQTVKNPLAMRETWVQSLAWEDTLKKEMATHASKTNHLFFCCL